MRVFLISGWLIAILFFTSSNSWAVESDVDRLLDLLVKEKVISQEKATDFRAELAVKKQDEKQPALVPDWAQNIKIKGDFRNRFEWDKNKGQADNYRERIRARLGVEGKINNKLKAAIGIATGSSSDPRSRDITLGNSSSTNTPGAPKSVILDYAYGQYTPAKWFSFTAGKFPNTLWQPFDVFWDNDLTEEGFGFNFSHKLTQKVDFFFNDLFFVLKNDSRTDKRPFLEALQPGINWAIDDRLNLKTALSYYIFDSVKGAQKFSDSKSGTAPYASSGNTIVSGNYKYNYNALQFTSEFSVKDPFGGVVPFASVFGDYIHNVSGVEKGADGFDIGLKFGNEKISDWNQWQGKLVYSKLGRDSWLDILTDNNRYGGNTNSQAFEAIFEYGIGKNTSIVLDYYDSHSLTKTISTNKAPEQVLQLDWNLKF